MNNHKPKLELTWIGKGHQPKLEPRILIEDPSKSYGDKNAENMLIYGDNLLALKALEQDFAGKIKCIYIDPPYNTGSAFEHYDDSLEHSIWFNLMHSRLVSLRTLLSNDGSLWITLDDNEAFYCKVMLDEIFGRNNFLGNIVWQHSIQGKNDAKGFSLHHNYIVVYRKSDQFVIGRVPRSEEHNTYYSNPDNDPKGDWRSGDVRSPNYRENLVYNLKTPSGKFIKPPEKGWRWSKETMSEMISQGEIFFSTDEKRIIRKIYLAGQQGRVPETIWFGEDVGTTREANQEIKDLFPNNTFATPKPERLIERVITLASNPNDWVLDSFLGSGTTSAVAHKMKRKWIGIELGDHCHTHCIPRLQKVCNGTDQGGISEAQNWKGGGGFRYYYLAPSLLKQDSRGNWIISKEYNAAQLAAAMAKHEGFRFMPDETYYWKQGKSTEKDFIFTTTNFVSVEFIDTIHGEMKSDESLLICCTSFSKVADKYPNITIKKIPKMLLGRCEFGKEDYSLNIINMPQVNDEPDFVPAGPIASNKPKDKKKDSATDDLFTGAKGGRK
jgi:adenine-specific DNA-methyltransferase